ncbi:zinc-dependent alcohol dehydrogenase family protein [Aestuariirhabdus litorea]|uniref:Zinc-binding dehydrogenase n=1 Tax=Aestuariirhabdus litorea TaxID=2528527 RepID=A0A3P3VQD2_9GAMM|nr:zinc-dependent alcohol dehydrogenase family protein [Aestuariirhabdus litorea]RRJ84830.1 zinc-binding dehydrogenase [Aestuariirhabdus litorea]RWW98055.1 zinc-binding dehydrogenase [Endozoicomonadaceae bacterium GTF-13]
MRSVQITHLSEGFDRVQLVDVEPPTPGPGQVRVKMLLSPVNPSDLNFIRGDYRQALEHLVWNRGRPHPVFDPEGRLPYPELPYALGGEGVGVVEACGSGWLARRLKGRRVAVAGGPPHGTWQDYCVVDARKALPVPDQLSDEQAAMFIVNPLSAYVMLTRVLRVKRGGWLLQSAAASSLGKIVIRLAEQLGVNTINLVRSKESADQLLAMGARHVLVGEGEGLSDQVAEITGGKGADYAMDAVGGGLAGAMVQCLGLGGHMVLFGTLANHPITLPSRDLMMPVARLTGFFALNWLGQQHPLQMLMILRELKRLQLEGIFEAPVERLFALEEVVAALEMASTKGRQGKVLLNIGQR